MFPPSTVLLKPNPRSIEPSTNRSIPHVLASLRQWKLTRGFWKTNVWRYSLVHFHDWNKSGGHDCFRHFWEVQSFSVRPRGNGVFFLGLVRAGNIPCITSITWTWGCLLALIGRTPLCLPFSGRFDLFVDTQVRSKSRWSEVFSETYPHASVRQGFRCGNRRDAKHPKKNALTESQGVNPYQQNGAPFTQTWVLAYQSA